MIYQCIKCYNFILLDNGNLYYNDKLIASEVKYKDIKKILYQTNSDCKHVLKKNNCLGCYEHQPNQMAHTCLSITD